MVTTPLKKRRRWVLFLGSPVLIAAGLWGWSKGSDLYDLYTGKMPMYDLQISLKVKGEAVSIHRIIPCRKKHQGNSYVNLFRKASWIAIPTERVVRKELSDGGAVTVGVPNVCRDISDANKTGGEENVVPPEYMPIITLFDDFDEPQVIKKILSRSYYQRADREINLISYQIIPARKKFPDFTGEFAWDMGGGYEDRKTFYMQRMIGTSIEKFRNGSDLGVSLRDLEQPTSLFELPNFKYPDNPLFPSLVSIDDGGQEYSQYVNKYISVAQITEENANPHSYDYVIPILQTLEGDTYDLNQSGYAVLYRNKNYADAGPRMVKESADGKTKTVRRVFYNNILVKNNSKIPLVVDKTWVNGGRGIYLRNSVFYDPETQKVYLVNRDSITYNF